MTDNPSAEQEIQARIGALVNLHTNSVNTRQRGNDENVLVWAPPREGINLGKSRPITFIKNRFLPSNVYETEDIQIFTEMNSLGELSLFMNYWNDIKADFLQDKSPLVVIEEAKNGQQETQLKVLRIVERDGVKKMYYVDIMQADNLTATENSSNATEITEENLDQIYPAVVKVKDLRSEFKGIGPKMENKLAVRFLSFGNVDLTGAQKQYLKPIIASVEEKIWER